MVRRSRLALIASLACAFFAIRSYGSASAQTLPRLHVASFSMRADTQTPRVGQPFHLEIAGRVREQIAAVDFVVLPNLGGLEPLGDERRAVATRSGTNFNETLTVVAQRGGAVHLAGAYFDALDARDGKAKRYYSNDLALNVIGAPPATDRTVSLRAFLIKLVAVLLAVFLLGALLRRRKKPLAETAAIVPTSPAVDEAAQSENGVRTALGALKVERNRSAVMALRHEVWKTAGAHGGETLSELFSRNGVAGGLQASLRTLERAAFISEDRLSTAIDDAIAAVERHA